MNKPEEINILLTSYNDLFSDFDPSAYTHRTLSDDFITQAKEISKNKTGNKIALNLLLPANKRNGPDEALILERLKTHFSNINNQLKSEVRHSNIKGLTLTIIGIILMIAASFISFIKPDKYHAHLLLVLFEPAGWFLLWIGLDHLVYFLKDTKKELAFYSKMVKSDVSFFSHETKYG